jgi:hypothetical protein
MGIKKSQRGGELACVLDRSRVKDRFLGSGNVRALQIAKSERFVGGRKLPKYGDRETVTLPRHGLYDNVTDEINHDITGSKKTGSSDGGGENTAGQILPPRPPCKATDHSRSAPDNGAAQNVALTLTVGSASMAKSIESR